MRGQKRGMREERTEGHVREDERTDECVREDERTEGCVRKDERIRVNLSDKKKMRG